ncbi:MAG: aminoacyl-tRNA hydrolase [Erysipelotrichaceae bacterium]|nr:aminoacyl-tRNA hydrolase [Erysipelotrichaceae bacterium]
MKLIAGLGNPGKEYDTTRHNAGFMAMDRILDKLSISLDKNKFNAVYTIYRYKDEKVIFVKPLTYMNLSGEAVQALMNFYDIDVKDILIIHDDLDLPVGKLRIRYQGSSGGQKGMGSIINHLGTSDINRIRIGISNDKLIDTKDYVLGKFSKEDKEILDITLDKAAEAALYFLDHPIEEVMSKFN